MAHMRVRSLFVLTLLQLCRAEISDSLPESWYSANVINDGFQPKPISEIFSTESPFSSTNPIIVLPKSSYTPDEILLLSTLPPPRKISSTSSTAAGFTSSVSSTTPLPPAFHSVPSSSPPPPTYQTVPSSTPPPPTFQTEPHSTFQSTQSSFQPTPSTFQPSSSTFQSTPSTFQSTLSTLAEFSSSTQAPILPLQTEFQNRPDPQPIFSLPQPVSNYQSSFAQSQPSSARSAQTQSQQIRLELVPQDRLFPVQNVPDVLASTQLPIQTSTAGPLSNYFLIYQQAPQSVQGFSIGTSQEVPQFTTTTQVTTPTPSTVIIQPAPTISPLSTRTAPPTSSTPFPSTVRVRTTQTPRIDRNCQNITNIPTAPRLPLSGLSGSLRIRVVSPKGSITNVNINPTSKTTTTRRPTTTRTKRTNKPKKNNYEACTDGCKGKREPICAAPLSSAFLDPDTLKGFPSVCHMACHNSYRKDLYEKVLDGRCGRLRTRIRTLDSNTKMKRDEMNKAQYFLDNSGTIVEFTALN